MRPSYVLCLLASVFALSASICAQQQANEATGVPHLIRFNGFYQRAGQPAQTAVVGATFSIYREQHDGTPLWSEIQNIQPDKDGNYTVLMGSTRADGMPLDLFTATESRWLEVEIDQVKQPRILLGSVPYALKSADADTLGGLPASAYLRVNPPTNSTTNNSTTVATAGVSPLASSGTPNTVAMFAANGTDVTNSVIYQTGNAVSIGGTASLGAMTLIGNVPSGDAAGMALYNTGGLANASVSLDMYNTTGNGGIPQAKIKALDDGNYSDHLTFWTKTPGAPTNQVTEKVRITSTGNVGIGTAAPGGKLEVAGNLKVSGASSGIIFPDGTMQTTALSTPAGGNLVLGVSALFSDTTGVNDTAIGSAALHNNTTGSLNTASGFQALFSNTTGHDNTANGYQALYNNSTASFNTADGNQALYSNTAGYNNTASGYQALYNNIGNSITGNNNTASGYRALYNTINGYDNTASGSGALFLSTNGNYNTAHGYGALYNAAGNLNIGLGYNAGSALAAGSSNIMLGNAGTANDDHVIRIGDVQTQTFIAGITGVNVSGVPVVISSSGQLGIAQSSRRFKEDIRDMGDDSQGLLRLRPVTFRYRQPFADGAKPIQYGLIAEEVAEVYPDLVARSADGQIETVKYQVLDSMLLNEIQRQNAQLTAQKEEIRSLQQRLARLESLLERTSPRATPDF